MKLVVYTCAKMTCELPDKLSVNEISYRRTPFISHVNTHETVEGCITELREDHNPKRYKYVTRGKRQNNFFVKGYVRDHRKYGLTNKVLLLWELILKQSGYKLYTLLQAARIMPCDSKLKFILLDCVTNEKQPCPKGCHVPLTAFFRSVKASIISPSTICVYPNILLLLGNLLPLADILGRLAASFSH